MFTRENLWFQIVQLFIPWYGGGTLAHLEIVCAELHIKQSRFDHHDMFLSVTLHSHSAFSTQVYKWVQASCL